MGKYTTKGKMQSILDNLATPDNKVILVDSNTGSDSNSGENTWSNALATLDAAFAKCTANNGDKILLAPGHSESYTTTGVKVTADVDGIEVISIGNGSDRATFSFGHVDATMTFSADNLIFKNVLFLTAVDSVVTFATISGNNCKLVACESKDVTDKEVITDFTVTGDDFEAIGHFKNGFITGDANDAVFSLNGVTNGTISGIFKTKVLTAVIEFVTAACTNINIEGTFLVSGTTDLSKNVVDTITGSVWSVKAFDIGAGSSFSGGSGQAVAVDDGGAISAAIAALNDLDSYGSKLGTKVTFAAADVLDNVQNALFTISGGKVLITSIVLEVSGAAVDASTGNTKLVYNPTVGTDTDMCAVADLNAAIVGTIMSITGTLTDALQFAAGGGLVGKQAVDLVLAEGTIDILSAADVGTGGALVSAEISYIPLDSGASIA